MELSHRVATIPASGSRSKDSGAVVAPRASSVRAGELMLGQGGNAVDAAVAAALVAGVVEPTETTLAGSGFMLVGNGQGEVRSIEFGPRAPQRASEAMFRIEGDGQASRVLGLASVEGNANIDGPLASGVPRTIAGLLCAHERFGRLPRRTVMDPAIRAAEEGFPADAWFVMNALNDLERLRADPGARAVFLDDDGLPRGRSRQSFYGYSVDTPEPVRQPVLAQTLDRLADEGAEAVTSGALAQALVETYREYGMLLSGEDLARSAPEILEPRSLRYRDARIHVPVAPGGGATELQILKIWQRSFPGGSPRDESGARIRRLALAMKHAFADRYHWLGDPDRVPVPVDELLSDEYAGRIAQACGALTVPESFGDGSAPWSHFSRHALHRPTEDTDRAPLWRPGEATAPTTGTTHITTADSEGRFVSVTHTAANHFGSGVLCPRTGLLFDSAMAWFNAVPGSANSIGPGARPLANMGPVLATGPRGTLAAAGASGGRRIVGAVAQVVINLLDRGMSPLDALRAPRIDASGPQLLLHEHLAEFASEVSDLAPVIVPAASNYFAMDFARANLVGRHDGGFESAIDAQAHSL